MLDVIKPRPGDGPGHVDGVPARLHQTQIELIKDIQVARRVVDDLKWSQNKALQREYRERDSGRELDFQHWATNKVVAGANATLISGSNILG
ncbi:MAG: hypothetical protein KIS90_00095 [Phenylobacterium sp.]|nr:hypothetical protein [Phenylobacterium sp.]